MFGVRRLRGKAWVKMIQREASGGDSGVFFCVITSGLEKKTGAVFLC